MRKIGFISLALPVFFMMVLACGSCDTSIPAQTTLTGSINPSDTAPSTRIHELPSEASDLSNWKITEAEAIAAASQYVPEAIALHAKISTGRGGNLKTGESRFYWKVTYTDISVTKAWLGWQSGNGTTMDDQDPYNQLMVTIDAVTGEFVSRSATYAVFIWGPDM